MDLQQNVQCSALSSLLKQAGRKIQLLKTIRKSIL